MLDELHGLGTPARFRFPAARSDNDHLYHGPQVNNQVPPRQLGPSACGRAAQSAVSSSARRARGLGAGCPVCGASV
jgi:hypothetical protein